MSATLMVTDHAEFYRVNPGEGETVYYPANGPTSRDAARKADAGGDPLSSAGLRYTIRRSALNMRSLYTPQKRKRKPTPQRPLSRLLRTYSAITGAIRT